MAKPKNNPTELTDLHNQIKTLDENWKRALADYQNLVRRVDQEKKEFVKLANVNLIARLVPSLDIMELAATHTQDMGVQMAAKQFHEALNEEGLQVVEPHPGEKFNPSLHECTEVLPVDENHPADTIAELVLKGYKINDYVLRPARVKAYQAPEIKGEVHG
jgi:molecular chaperone GrpE